MATRVLMTLHGGLARFEVDYDEANRITAFRCVNDSDYDVFGEITRTSDGRSIQKTFYAHTNTYLPVPTNVAQRIQFSEIGAHGELVGLSMKFGG